MVTPPSLTSLWCQITHVFACDAPPVKNIREIQGSFLEICDVSCVTMHWVSGSKIMKTLNYHFLYCQVPAVSSMCRHPATSMDRQICYAHIVAQPPPLRSAPDPISNLLSALLFPATPSLVQYSFIVISSLLDLSETPSSLPRPHITSPPPPPHRPPATTRPPRFAVVLVHFLLCSRSTTGSRLGTGY
jgi:hypothetical protein